METIINHPALIKGKLFYDDLIGVEFEHSKTDCYDLGRRFMLNNFGIELRNYARPDDWWLGDSDLYNKNFQNEGFYVVDTDRLEDIRIADWFLIALPDQRNPAKTVANHCGIYVGDGKMLHHRLGKRSQVVPYRGMYRNLTTAIIRHKDVPDLTKRKESTVDVMDYILPHKREMLLGALNDRQEKDRN